MPETIATVNDGYLLQKCRYDVRIFFYRCAEDNLSQQIEAAKLSRQCTDYIA